MLIGNYFHFYRALVQGIYQITNFGRKFVYLTCIILFYWNQNQLGRTLIKIWATFLR